MYKAGHHDESIALVRSGAGERLKQEILGLAGEVERAERDELALRRRQVAQYADRTPWVLLLLLGGMLTVVFGLYDAVTRENRERRKAETVLRESEGRFRGSFEAAAVGMALIAPEGRFLKVNGAVCEMLGLEEADLLARDFQSITHPDDLDADLALFRRALDGEIDTYQMEKRYLYRDGRTVHAILAVSLVRDGGGRPLHFVAQIQDVTPRVLAERKADEDRRFIGRIADAVPSVLYVHDLAEGRNVWSNAKIAEILGLPADRAEAEVAQPSCPRLVHPDDRPRVLEGHLGALGAAADGEVREAEYRMRPLDGSCAHGSGAATWSSAAGPTAASTEVLGDRGRDPAAAATEAEVARPRPARRRDRRASTPACSCSTPTKAARDLQPPLRACTRRRWPTSLVPGTVLRGDRPRGRPRLSPARARVRADRRGQHRPAARPLPPLQGDELRGRRRRPMVAGRRVRHERVRDRLASSPTSPT